MEEVVNDEDRGALGKIEEMVGKLLTKYQELKKERDELAVALNQERERSIEFEKKLEALSLDKEKVKTRIDQLLYRLKGIDL
jgi:RNase H-fold protein (predicted Holliday junction resolvase)